MSDLFTKRVRAAAMAGWWTILIAAIWMTAAWLGYLLLLSARPGWLLRLWGGGDLDWDYVQAIMLKFFAIFKLGLFFALMVVIWLTLWQRRLRKETDR